MLEAKLGNWFSRDLIISENEQPVAKIRFDWSFKQGELTVGKVVYAIRQDPPGYCSYILQDGKTTIAHARAMKTILYHSCTIEYSGSKFRFEDKSTWRRYIAVREGVQYVGYIESKHLFASKVTACLPVSLPLAIRGFMIALATRLWNSKQTAM
jgi:hypothetical protein